MMSAKFLRFWTSPRQHFGPIYSTKITQPPLLRQNLGNPPPSPSLLTSFVNGPYKYKRKCGRPFTATLFHLMKPRFSHFRFMNISYDIIVN